MSPNEVQPKRNIEDVVSEMLSSGPPVAGLSHIHVFRKEYPKCMLKGCRATNKNYSQGMVGN